MLRYVVKFFSHTLVRQDLYFQQKEKIKQKKKIRTTSDEGTDFYPAQTWSPNNQKDISFLDVSESPLRLRYLQLSDLLSSDQTQYTPRKTEKVKIAIGLSNQIHHLGNSSALTVINDKHLT